MTGHFCSGLFATSPALVLILLVFKLLWILQIHSSVCGLSWIPRMWFMRDKRWLEVSKFDGVPFQLFFVSFSSDSSSLLLSLLLIKIWNPHVMDTDEWRDLEFLIWFLQIGRPMGWWLSLHFLVSASEGRTLWHHLPGGLLPALACEGYMAGSWTELMPCCHTWLE